MSQDNIAIVRQFYDEVMSKGNLDLIDDIIADDMIEHEEIPGLSSGKEGVRQFMSAMRQAFPDLRVEAEDIIAGGDKVATRGRLTGTHRSDFMDIPATNNGVDVPFYDILRFSDGKVVEHWGLTDMMTMMQQLGVIPTD